MVSLLTSYLGISFWYSCRVWNSPMSINVAQMLYLFQSDPPSHDISNESPHTDLKNKEIVNCSNYKSKIWILIYLNLVISCVKVCPTISNVAGGGSWSISHPMVCDCGSSDQQVDPRPCEGQVQPSANSLAGDDAEWLTRSTHTLLATKCRA